MDTLTPAGRQTILDLLAKSIEKVNELDSQNRDEKVDTETRKPKKEINLQWSLEISG